MHTIFPNRVISKRGTIQKLPWSPDLTPSKFFLVVNQQKINEVFINIKPKFLVNILRAFYDRFRYCVAQSESLFDHIL